MVPVRLRRNDRQTRRERLDELMEELRVTQDTVRTDARRIAAESKQRTAMAKATTARARKRR